MSSLDLTRSVWRKSSRSDGSGGQCVELALQGQAVRDSKNPAGVALVFDPHSAERFLSAVKAGRFDG